MKNSIREELTEHLNNLIEDGVLTLDNLDDWHFHAFNEDYYIIGFWNADQWMQKHNLSAFEAIKDIQEYEQMNFGEVTTDFSSSEAVVNMYVYIKGEELLQDIQEELKEKLEGETA